MLDFVIRFIVVNIILVHLFALLVVKLVDRLQPLHRPVCELPRLAPPDVHRLRADYDDHQLDAFIADTRCQTWSCRRCDARLYAIDAALTQHQVRVVPLVRFSVPVRVLLHDVRLRAHDLLEQWDLHGL